MRTIVYIDGLNLYYRALRKTPYRWLNLAKLLSLMLPGHDIVRIRYYTALVTARGENLDQIHRQQIYLRALSTIPRLFITLGEFTTSPRMYPLASDPSKFVRVLRTDEKGSDVSLAAHLIYEGMKGDYDTAAVLSNDSDLLEPIRIMTQEAGRKVGVLSPIEFPNRVLLRYATFYASVRRSALAASQFPSLLEDEHGPFHKPASW